MELQGEDKEEGGGREEGEGRRERGGRRGKEEEGRMKTAKCFELLKKI